MKPAPKHGLHPSHPRRTQSCFAFCSIAACNFLMSSGGRISVRRPASRTRCTFVGAATGQRGGVESIDGGTRDLDGNKLAAYCFKAA